ncbi:MAG: bifunctional DNA primase/polymerase, partial [Nitrososphaeraceae archaeon]
MTSIMDYSRVDVNSSNNQWSNYWRRYIGANVIPADCKNRKPKVEWKQYQDTPIPESQHELWKTQNLFDEGMAIICGKIWHRSDLDNYHIIGFDADNAIAKQEFLSLNGNGKALTLEQFASKTLVEQHLDNRDKLHWYAYTIGHQLQDKTSDIGKPDMDNNTKPAFEIKATSKFLMYCSPSIHKNGHKYQVLGTVTPFTLLDDAPIELQKQIDGICEKYGLTKGGTKNNQIPIKDLFKSDTVIYEGHNRHVELLRVMESLLSRNKGILSTEQIIQLSREWNNAHCSPPLDDQEFRNQWNCATGFIASNQEGKSGNGNSDTIQIQEQGQQESSKPAINPYTELDPYIPDRDYFEYIIKTAKRTVKCEDSLVRQIEYVIVSKDTNNPLNLAILCPTSEGKTHAIKESVQYAPEKEVLKIGSMSPKVLIRDHSILIDGDTHEPIEPEIRKLRRQLRSAKKDKNEELEDEINDQIHKLYDNSKRLINLHGKVIIFLEPPHPDTWRILKPILSHDSWEIEHPYVDKIEGIGQITIKIVTRGWPACIFCSAKNESNWPEWPEIQSRFMITSTNMIQQKYLEGNLLISQRMGLPNSVQKTLIVSDDQAKLARKCFSYILQQTKKQKNSQTWIPYWSYLFESLPSEKGTDNRLATRVFHLLNIIAQCRAHLRCKLRDGDDILTIPDIKHDLTEVLHIIKNVSGIPTFKLKVFKEVFLQLYNSKTEPNKSKDKTKEETIIAVTTKELREYIKEKMHKIISSDNIKRVYLDEFLTNGLIDYEESVIDKKQNIYFPIVDISSYEINEDTQKSISFISDLGPSDNNLQAIKLLSPKIHKRIPKSWLELQLLFILQYRMGKDNSAKLVHFLNNKDSIDITDNLDSNNMINTDGFALLDENSRQICIHEFQKKLLPCLLIRYYSNLDFCDNSDEIDKKVQYLEQMYPCSCKNISDGTVSDNNDMKSDSDSNSKPNLDSDSYDSTNTDSNPNQDQGTGSFS